MAQRSAAMGRTAIQRFRRRSAQATHSSRAIASLICRFAQRNHDVLDADRLLAIGTFVSEPRQSVRWRGCRRLRRWRGRTDRLRADRRPLHCGQLQRHGLWNRGRVRQWHPDDVRRWRPGIDRLRCHRPVDVRDDQRWTAFMRLTKRMRRIMLAALVVVGACGNASQPVATKLPQRERLREWAIHAADCAALGMHCAQSNSPGRSPGFAGEASAV